MLTFSSTGLFFCYIFFLVQVYYLENTWDVLGFCPYDVSLCHWSHVEQFTGENKDANYIKLYCIFKKTNH